MHIGRLISAGIFSLLFSVFVHGTMPVAVSQSTPQSVTQEAAPASHISRNWAGYVTEAGTFTGVTGTWVVPQVSGDVSGADATWVGVGGVSTHDLIQAGTQATVEDNGAIDYQAFWETLPSISQPFSLDIHPGDTITTSVIKEPNGKWHITLANNTTNQKNEMVVSYDSSLSSAEWIEEAPSGMHRTLPLDNFGTVSFQRATAIVNNKEVSLSDSGATALAMGDMYGQMLATASTVGNDGNSFSISRAGIEVQSPDNPLTTYRMHLRQFLLHEGFFR